MNPFARTSISKLRALLWLLLGSLLALSWGVVYWERYEDELRALERMRTQTGDLALAFAEHTRSSFSRFDFILQDLRRDLGGMAAVPAEKLPLLQTYLGSGILQISVVDAQGGIRYSSLGPIGSPVSVADREHFAVHARNGGDRLFVSPPVKGRVSGQWSLQLTRPLLQRGKFAGVLVLSVAPAYFPRFSERLRLGREGLVVVVRDSGEIMARSTGMEEHIGKVVSTLPYGAPQAPLQGNYRRLSQADGVDRVTSYHRLPEYGLTVIVGVGVDEGLAVAREHHRRQVWGASLVSIVMLVLGGLLLHGLAARRRDEEALRESEVGFRAVFDNAAAGIARTSPEGRFLQINDKYCEIIGYSREEVLAAGLTFQQITPPEDLDANLAVAREALAGGIDRYTLEKRYLRKDGRLVWVMLSSHLVRDEGGQPQYFVAAVQDISARKLAEEKLRLAASVFSSSYEGIMITDAENRIVDVNPAFSRITGYLRDEVLGKPPGLLSSGRQGAEFYRGMWASLKLHDEWRGEIWNRRRNGEVYAEILAISVVRDGQGAITHYIGVFSDISQLKAHEAELNRIAHYDALTGVPNRRLLADRMSQGIARARRAGKSLAVCYLDLDGFKTVNDVHGHAVGDHLLVEITNRLRGVLRGDDTLARLGGDEFVLLFVDLAHANECEVALDRVLAAVSQPVIVGGATLSLSASIGVALFPADDADPDTLLRHADHAMYRAKEAGRNRYHLFDPAHDRQLKDHRQRLRRMGDALAAGEFTLYYQPKVDLYDGSLVGAEALIRWNDPERGLVMPGAFLDYMSGTDLEIAVGEWVIETALCQIATWNAAGLRVPVSVNISADHLLHAEFVQRLMAALARHPDVSPADVELEILESAALADMDRAVAVINECMALGVGFSLDDFGTGYSSLAYFRALPVHMLKIDQSFVRHMLEDAGDLSIVESVVRLAQVFGRLVIAEGVESIAHGAKLVELGCRLGQGWGLGRPMPPEDFPDWLAQWSASRAWQQMARRH